MKKRLLALVMALLTALCITGCTAPSGDPNSEFSDRPNHIVLSYYYGGYGSEYWNALARDFMTNYDEGADVYLEMKPFYDGANMRSLIEAGNGDGDIIYLAVDMFRQTEHIEELSGFFEMTPLGESQTIKQKAGTAYDYYVENYKEGGVLKEGIFQLGGAGKGGGYNFAYNKTTIDQALGEDNYELPVTTEEFFEFGNTLYENGVYLTSAAIADAGGGDYLEYCYKTWLVQHLGIEAYDAFSMGEVYDNGEWKLADFEDENAPNYPRILTDNEKAIKDTYDIMNTLFTASNNYLHSSTREFDYLDNDTVFAGGGFGSNRAKTAFLFIGQFFEKEIQPLIADGLVEDGQEYGVMRVPVSSALVEYLEYDNMSDELLAKIIRSIDAGNDYEATKTGCECPNLTQTDFDRIKEARKLVVNQICSEFVVPNITNQSKEEHIYNVLRYLVSDRAQIVAAKETGGVTMLPFGRSFDDEDLGFARTRFVKEGSDIANDMIVIDYAHINTIASQQLKHSFYKIPGGSRASGYIYTSSNPQSSDEMFTNLVNELKGLWKQYVSNYKTAMNIGQ